LNVIEDYFDVLIKQIREVYQKQNNEICDIAKMMSECMFQGGVVQLFGTYQGMEFCNELNYRAGGIAYFHSYNIKDLLMRNIITNEEVYATGEAYNKIDLVDEFEKIYELDNRDMYCIISQTGNEPLAIEIAKRAKEKNQKVVAIINKKTYDKNNGELLNYVDEYIDLGYDDPDYSVNVDGIKCGQTNTTVANTIAQMLHAEIYRIFMEKKGEAPVLLSMNIKGADEHNAKLTDPYGRRIR
jgi:uncharacterized phosphosugar-binding protein